MHELTKLDVDSIIERASSLIEQGRRSDARDAIEDFLEHFVFRYFVESPYQAIVRGPLKPTYQGQLHHSPSVSSALIERLLNDPKRLRTIKNVLETSAPDFASPIYIGMSENLGRRLMHHRKLIGKFRDTLSDVALPQDSELQSDQRDQSFARQIAERRINPQRLFVMIRQIDADSNQSVDLENILNRIHHPLLGRN